MDLSRNDMSNEECAAALEALLCRFIEGQLRHGALGEVAQLHNVHPRTISRLWTCAQESRKPGAPMNVATRKHLTDRKKTNTADTIKRLQYAPVKQRRTLRSAAEACGVSYTQPLLDKRVREQRHEFCKSFIDEKTMTFKDMYDCIHLDEKWFFLATNTLRCHLASGEVPPLQIACSKRLVVKVMFLVVVARSRWDRARDEWFDGKVGMWPLTQQVQAERSSRNRPKRTLVTKPIASVDKHVYRTCLIEKVLPAIAECWPQEDRRHLLFLQQDNASPHIAATNPDFLAAVVRSGLDVHLRNQPPNSPDLNVLDLGFFASIQALQQRIRQDNIDELVAAVDAAYSSTIKRAVNNVHLTLQVVMDQIIQNNGGDNFQIKHMSKEKLEREGALPVNIRVSDSAVAALSYEASTFSA